MHRHFGLLVLLAAVGSADVLAQEPVHVGKGSYAESPPPSAGKGAEEMVKRTFPLVGKADRPIPTNKLWTWLFNGKASGSLWMYPLRIDPKNTGVDIFFPIKWLENGSDPVCDSPLKIEGIDFRASGLLVKDWGDWTLSFRLPQSEKTYFDVTVGEGMPVVWVESHGVGLALKAGPEAAFTQTDGRELRFPAAADRFLVSSAGRLYGVFAPPETRLARDGAGVRLEFPADKSFLAIAAIKRPQDLALVAKCAYSIPRDSRMDWSYDAERGKVTTTWTVKTEPLVPGSGDVALQGWLAHHWRGASCSMQLDGPEYLTPRGLMKSCLGNRFELIYDFDGFLPNLPAPTALGLPHDFDPKRMAQLLDRRAQNPKYGDDSYWGGKDLLHFAQYLQMTRELKDGSYAKLRAAAHQSLTDWLTYTPGEDAHYFTRYENWRALIGIKDSYDSARFNDQHFHYGYLIHSAALLAMEDPAFLQDYGEMLRLVAKQYANWDRQDQRFPFLRTFDVWAGHSWAGGLGSPGGNNQESSSEAMQSWIGLYLLGTMLDDPDMTAAGAMGYAVESRATMEYWFNMHGDILPQEYRHPIVGVLWSGGQVFGTYFSGDPAWVYAIQCLPQSPGLDYLVRDPDFARKLFQNILALRKAKEGSDELGQMGDLGNVLLAQASLLDPDSAVRQLDRLWDENNGIAREHLDSARTYYLAHAYRRLGRRQWDVRLSVPTGATYFDRRTSTAFYVAYNPREYPVIVQATKGDAVLGTFVAPPRQLTCVTKLERTAKQPGLAGSLPADGDTVVSRRIDKLYLLFSRPVGAKSLEGLRLEGVKPPAVSCATDNKGQVVVCKLAGPLRPGETYRLIVPASIQWQAGGAVFSREQTIAFTLESQPALAVEESVPADGQVRVDVTAPNLLLTFNAPMDPQAVRRIHLDGPDAPALTTQLSGDGTQLRLNATTPLQHDHTYSLIVPSGVASVFGDAFRSDRVIRFSTTPLPCPPNVYRESFAGDGYSADPTLEVDMRNTDSAHTGQHAIKLHATTKDGMVYFFAGTSDHGEGRRPVDLSPYKQIEFWMRGTPERVWVKIGHPVFDKAFTQAQMGGVTQEYKRFTLDLPEPKTQINTLLVIGIAAGETVYLDDIRFVAPGGQHPPDKPEKSDHVR